MQGPHKDPTYKSVVGEHILVVILLGMIVGIELLWAFIGAPLCAF